MQLPSHLSSLSTLLGLFTEDSKSLLLSIVKQLSPLIHSVSASEIRGCDEPDGFDGIGQQTHYERLLLSEWMMLEINPDEFIRRASSGEHLFKRLASIEKQESRRYYALFDCGPSQLGKPRIVQLAVLILLSRWAEKSRASFHWGILQDRGVQFYQGVTEALIKNWLDKRSIEPVNETHIASWLAAIDNDMIQSGIIHSPRKEKFIDDCWLISDTHNPFQTRFQRSISINEDLFDAQTIRAKVRSSGSIKNTEITLPKDNINIKILRNPFQQEQKVNYSVSPKSNGLICISPNGNTMATIDNKGEVTVFHIKKSSHKIKIKYQFNAKPDTVIVGIYLASKRCTLLCEDESFLYLQNYPHQGETKTFKKPETIYLYKAKYLGICNLLMLPLQGKLLVKAVDYLNRPVDLWIDETSAKLTHGDLIVKSQGRINSTNYCLLRDASKNQFIFKWQLEKGDRESTRYFPEESSRIEIFPRKHFFITDSATWKHNSIGCIALNTHEYTWLVIVGEEQYKIEQPQDLTFVGIWADMGSLYKPKKKDAITHPFAFIAIKSDDKTIVAFNGDGAYQLNKLPSDFLAGELNTNLLILHYTDKKKDLLAFDILSGETILSIDGCLERR